MLCSTLSWSGLSCAGDCLSVDCPVNVAVAVEVDTLDLPPVMIFLSFMFLIPFLSIPFHLDHSLSTLLSLHNLLRMVGI